MYHFDIQTVFIIRSKPKISHILDKAYVHIFIYLQVIEELERVKQDMDERGSSMTDGGMFFIY